MTIVCEGPSSSLTSVGGPIGSYAKLIFKAVHVVIFGYSDVVFLFAVGFARGLPPSTYFWRVGWAWLAIERTVLYLCFFGSLYLFSAIDASYGGRDLLGFVECEGGLGTFYLGHFRFDFHVEFSGVY